MKDPLTIIALLIMICTFCGTPLLIVVMVVYAFRVQVPRRKAAIEHLAEEMGLTPTEHPRRGRRYVGMHRGYAFDIGAGVSRTYGSALAVTLYVPTKEPLRGYAGCNRRQAPGASFERAFGKARMGMEDLPHSACAAMLAFVRKHEYLRLEGAPLHPKPGALPESGMRLEHVMSGATPETTRAVLDEMVEIARVLETSRG
jgi:hypothetical protein